MIINIPGREEINIENIVFDYNGTIAVGGVIKPSIREKIRKLTSMVNCIVLTADTYGDARVQCDEVGLNIITFEGEGAGQHKRRIVENLSPEKCLCIGNGFNDIQMCTVAALSIGIIEGEGISGRLISSVDIVINTIDDALDLILNPKRMIATLRN
ncbi:MAG: HAD family hydrolase [Clostridium sp.]|uniref:HAD family hydrolase n=1 Tax=Clostridium sp. TaxID=1506 RepID=UPI002FCBDA3D